MERFDQMNNSDYSGVDLSVVLPTLNEEGNIGRLIIEIFEVLPLCQIIVVDDSSTDDTVKEIEDIKKIYSSLILIKKDNKRCLTESIQIGIDAAENQFIG
jgi:dolichol-phosphate mannosyltransferase